MGIPDEEIVPYSRPNASTVGSCRAEASCLFWVVCLQIKTQKRSRIPTALCVDHKVVAVTISRNFFVSLCAGYPGCVTEGYAGGILSLTSRVPNSGSAYVGITSGRQWV